MGHKSVLQEDLKKKKKYLLIFYSAKILVNIYLNLNFRNLNNCFLLFLMFFQLAKKFKNVFKFINKKKRKLTG